MSAAAIPPGMADEIMNEFKNYHPIVNFVYFLFIIGFSMFFMHPIYLFISLAGAFVYSVVLKGKKAIKNNLIYMLPTITIAAFINAAFNHEGITILLYFPSGNPLTLESLVYGFAAALMIISVMCWFSCYNEIMTSDKFIYLFGRVVPGISLILSMTLRFVPKFREHLKEVVNAQRCMGRDISNGNIISRAKHGINILSVMATWSLENAIDTADSMKSRGYGLTGRTAFSIFTFDKRDKKALFFIIICGIYVFVGNFKITFRFFPSIKIYKLTPFEISVFTVYLIMCVFPLIIEIREVIRWKILKSKI